MKKLILISIIVLLGGCIAYPSKHLVSPEYTFSFEDLNVLNASIQLGIESDDACNDGTKLDKVNSHYVSPKTYSWFKVAWFIPVTSSNNLYLCVNSHSGESYQWQTQLYYYGSLEPENKRFKCNLNSNKLACVEQKT